MYTSSKAWATEEGVNMDITAIIALLNLLPRFFSSKRILYGLWN